MIPKKVHYCWFGKKEMPDLAKRCMETWYKYLPDYEFKLWNEENSPMTEPFLKYVYENKMYGFTVDYMRFYALYNEGGIYLDVDIEVVKPFDDLLNNKCFIGYESKRHLGFGILGGEKGFQFFNEFMDYINNVKIIKSIPFVFEKYVKETYGTTNYEEIFPDITFYPPEYFYPYNPWLRGYPNLMYDDIKENTYAIHHWQKSWDIPKKVKVRNKLYKLLNLLKLK